MRSITDNSMIGGRANMRLSITITLVSILLTLPGTQASGEINKGPYVAFSLHATEVEGDFDNSLMLWSGGATIIDVPEIGRGYGAGLAYGHHSAGFLGGEISLKLSLQDAGQYGSGMLNFAGHGIVSPFNSSVQPFVKIGGCWNFIWVDNSDYLYGSSMTNDADYMGFGIEVIPGIDIRLARGDRIRGLRLEAGYRLINYGYVSGTEISDALKGGTYLASISYLHGW